MTDEDERLLASRFASAEGRDDLAALYAFDAELGRIAPAVSQPLLGEIRLAWWREGLEELDEKPARSPVLAALASPRLKRHSLIALVEAREAELEPFADEPALLDFIDRSQGGLMLAAAQALDPAVRHEQVRDAARAYALSRLPDRWRPLSWAEAGEAETASHLRARVWEALKGAQTGLRDLPTAAFPAVAHATLARISPQASGLSKRLRLLWAVARGKV